MNNAALRESLIQQAEASFTLLSTQLDHLLDLVAFYLDRHPHDGTRSADIKTLELKLTVENLAVLTTQLAEVLAGWKAGTERVLSRMGTELTILNEISANAQALIYFLMSHDIDLEPFDLTKANVAFVILKKCNSLLT